MILVVSIGVHGPKEGEKEVVIDSTVQEKNVTYPTDTKADQDRRDHRRARGPCKKRLRRPHLAGSPATNQSSHRQRPGRGNRGSDYRGTRQIDETEILAPSPKPQDQSPHQTRTMRTRFRRCCAIEPVIAT
jgi:hypothetical protein